MIDTFLDFFASKWLEISTLIVACGGLVYAHLAFRTSKLGLGQASRAELTNLRILAKASLSDAEQSLVSLQLNCAIHRAAAEAERLRNGPKLSSSTNMFSPQPSDKVAAKAQNLLQGLGDDYANIDKLDLPELEELMRKAKLTSLKIQALASELSAPN
jgi:hypothetical protein